MKQFNVKKSFRSIITTMAAGALLVTPAGTAIATNGHGDHGDQRAAREFSRQRGEREQHDGWWNDWRFGEGKEWWENRPQTCEQRQASVQRETNRLKRSSQKQHRKISWQVDYQKWYVQRHNLSPENFDQLTAGAETERVEARQAINALATPTVDCNQPAENDKALLQANKQPVINALRDYHISAITVTYAVQAAK